MAKFRKLASVLLAVAMAVTAMFALSATASAASVFSGAKTMKELNTYSWTPKSKPDQVFYKLTLPDSGKLTIRAADGDWTSVRLFDAKAKELSFVADWQSWYSGQNFTVPQKGTYYLKFACARDGGFIKGVYWSFERDEKPTITISETLNVGDKINLSAAIANYDGKAKWTTSNKKVATIENGVLKAVGEGKATITASIDYETVLDEIRIVVKKAKVPTVTIAMSAKVGDKLDLSASTANYSGKVSWGTTDPKVATVDNGKVTVLGAGSVIVQAALDDGTYTRIKLNVTK
ncbi:MAG: Ig-like domain-containing protein [Ruminiclostridium sp.]|nr:Ig-like domain-containing protein [Ruminiclostridium sp.]